MKYLLLIHMNPHTWEAMSEDEHNEVFAGHNEFMKMITESGEFVSNVALADPTQSATVRVRDGVRVVTDGPYVEAKEYLAGYYLVDVDSPERAMDLAAMIPDASFNAMEVRQVMDIGGSEM
ncbi:MAG TPA: YciI family protein [Pseudonocardiaceae bacterium]|nr:YciI family protein [Pseudonocardiaceae bacterium]